MNKAREPSKAEISILRLGFSENYCCHKGATQFWEFLASNY